MAALALLWDLLAYPLAQEPFVHSQTFAVVIVLLLVVLVRTVMLQLRAGTRMIAPREETIALAGVALASIATLLCCLLAPGPAVLSGAPGATAAVPEHSATVAFPRTATRFDNTEELRARVVDGDRAVEIGARLPAVLGDVIYFVHARTVATIEARGIGGDTLTVTQPTGAAFLSPLLLFPKTTAIAELTLPSDTFAVPARGYHVRAFLVTRDLMHDGRVARMSNGLPGVLFAADDANGKPLVHGIGFAADGLPAQIAQIVVQPRLGCFPSVTAASVPSPIPMLIGIAALVFGFGTLWHRRRTGAAP